MVEITAPARTAPSAANTNCTDPCACEVFASVTQNPATTQAGRGAATRHLLESLGAGMAAGTPRATMDQRRIIHANVTAHSAYALALGWVIPELLALAASALVTGKPVNITAWLETNQVKPHHIREADEGLAAMTTHAVLWSRLAGVAGDSFPLDG